MTDAAPEPCPFADLDGFVAIPRVTGLAVSAAGRVVVAVDALDDAGGARTGALWELDPAGGEPRRLTRSAAGESAPAFLPDGTLVFTSARADDEPALWALPPGGEAEAIARYPGGVRGPVAARSTPALLAGAARPVGADPAGDPDGSATRTLRKDRKVDAILHTGMPIRHWDHELGDLSPRLLLVSPGAEPVDLAPDATFELTEASYDLAADGTLVSVTWTDRCARGRTRTGVALIEVAGAHRRVLFPAEGDYGGPRLSPDGSVLAVARQVDGTFDVPMTVTLCLVGTGTGAGPAVEVDLGDLYPTEWCWTPGGESLLVAGDRHGRGAVVVVDAASGRVVRRLAADAAYGALTPAPGGDAVYALRSSPSSPPTVARLELDRSDQEPRLLPFPGASPELPGVVEEITARAPDGSEVRSWLCRPAGEDPAPVMLWVHGGPFSSWNAWSWRWNPWVAVARGWAVLLPDPALSTGYGPAWFARAWPHRAAAVWQDLEAVLDAALARPDLDGDGVACLGGSFGGYMTNWIAGHTDRFGAIVTHAGLWALDQQHATTDAAEWKTGLFGTVEEHPEWYADNSPHRFVDRIRTPMLVVHGNRDYRVPVSEALRLWWDLVSRHDGPPDALPHRFLQFTGEHHWVLGPANSRIWYETVLGFCERHVLGRPVASPPAA